MSRSLEATTCLEASYLSFLVQFPALEHFEHTFDYEHASHRVDLGLSDFKTYKTIVVQ
uniref:Uncharacterized protein n=1 Tax=Helianthus annuus TaxID=4232 RepID=A0A251VKN1_HELAN